MDLGIAGKTAVVTGASSGLGEAIASRLAAEGANLVLFARRGPLLEQQAATLSKQYGVAVAVVAGDMTRAEDVARLTEAASSLKGGPDILVLNTGRPPSPMREVLEETDDARWEEAYKVQLWGGIMVARAITPKLVAKGWGRVVAVTSATVRQPMVKHGLSTVFRAGLTGFLKHLANEVAATGVTVNNVCPGSVATESLRRSYNVDDRAATLPMRRVGRPEEVADTVAFFTSHNAGFITGASLQVDGGQVASLT